MAVLSDLTNEQRSTIEYSLNIYKSVKKRRDNAETATEAEMLDEYLERIKGDINFAYNAKEIFDSCIRLANYYLTLAEKIQKEMGIRYE